MLTRSAAEEAEFEVQSQNKALCVSSSDVRKCTFGVDPIPSKYGAGIADTETNTDAFNL